MATATAGRSHGRALAVGACRRRCPHSHNGTATATAATSGCEAKATRSQPRASMPRAQWPGAVPLSAEAPVVDRVLAHFVVQDTLGGLKQPGGAGAIAACAL